MLYSIKLKGVGDIRSTLITNMEMQNLEYANLGFSLVLFQYFLNSVVFIPFWNDNVYCRPFYVGCMGSFFFISILIRFQ